MMTDTLFAGISQLVTPHPGPQRGKAMAELSVMRDVALLVSGDVIEWIGPERDAPQVEQTIDLGGVAVVPGLVDPHTHAVWAGERLGDFEARVEGVPYEEILALGGGIRSTIRATARTSVEELVALARPRLQALRASGATTIEVKSGYGLDFAAELRMLRAIRQLQDEFNLVPTLLIHLPPTSDRAEHVDGVCRELIPEVASAGLASAVDVFCEQEAFSVEETRQIFQAARENNLHIKVHSDQFHALGATELACKMNALSADHLEASKLKQIRALAASGTVATVLPGVSLHLGLPAAAGRKLIDAGAAVAVGTDLNPGSSPLFSSQLALALSVRLNGLMPAEALTACTVNAAAALGFSDRGALVVGQRADFLALHAEDWREIAYVLGGNVVRDVFVCGRRC